MGKSYTKKLRTFAEPRNNRIEVYLYSDSMSYSIAKRAYADYLQDSGGEPKGISEEDYAESVLSEGAHDLDDVTIIDGTDLDKPTVLVLVGGELGNCNAQQYPKKVKHYLINLPLKENLGKILSRYKRKTGIIANLDVSEWHYDSYYYANRSKTPPEDIDYSIDEFLNRSDELLKQCSPLNFGAFVLKRLVKDDEYDWEKHTNVYCVPVACVMA